MPKRYIRRLDGTLIEDNGATVDSSLAIAGAAADAKAVGDKLSEVYETIADNKNNIEKLLDANSEVIIKGDEYDWAAGYFDANGHFNGAYYYRIAIKQWFEVEPGETYRFQSNSTDKLLIRGYRGTTGYDFVETLVTLEADKTITIPESINHITITLSRAEDNGDSIAIINQMLAEAAEGLIDPTVTKLFTLNTPDFTDCVRTVNGIEPDENGNVEINIPETGGGSAVKKIGTYIVSEDVNTVIIDADENGNPFGCDVLCVDMLFKSTAQNTKEANVTFQPLINGNYTELSVSMRYSARISGTIHRTVTAWLTQPTEPSNDAGGIGVQIVHDTAVPTRVGYSATKHNKIDGIKLYCGTQYIAAGSIIVISGR